MSLPVENEYNRLTALDSYNILDTATEQDYDEITELAAAICGTPISLISLVDKGRQWFKSHTGLNATETERSHSFCAHAILNPAEIMQVNNATEDDRFKDNPLVTGDPHIAFYAGVPLVDKEGYALGSLCVIDRKPGQLSETQQKALRTLGKQVIDKLELRRKMNALADSERQTSELQQQLNLTLAELREKELNLRLAGEAADLGLWILDLQTNIMTTSENYRRQMGFSPDHDITLQDVFEVIDPGFIPLVEQTIQDSITKRRDPVVEFVIRHKITGEERWIRGVGKIETDAGDNLLRLIGMNIDITDQKFNEKQVQLLYEELQATNEELRSTNEEQQATNEELHRSNEQLQEAQNKLVNLNDNLYQSEEKLRLAIESSGLGTWYMNTETRELLVSPRLKELFGYHADETMPYEAAVNQIQEDYRQKVTENIEAAISEFGMYDIEYPVLGYHDNKLRWVRATGKIYEGQNGKPATFFGTVDDITERKQDEQRRSDFIGMVSHELRNPLTSINGYLQIMQLRTASSADALSTDLVTKSLKQVEKMRTLIKGFLDAAHMGEGKIQLDYKLFDMAELVKAAEEECISTVTSHQIVFYPVEFTLVNADPDKIEQVIINFINNAVKYSSTGSLINVACISRNGKAHVSVSDEGMGIAINDQPYIFDRFYRVNNEQMKKVEGFGIGLYICKEIIERHGGQIGVESIEGKGSTFWFDLPIHVPSIMDI